MSVVLKIRAWQAGPAATLPEAAIVNANAYDHGKGVCKEHIVDIQDGAADNSVGFIGMGRVGAALSRALAAQGVRVKAIYSRNAWRARNGAEALPDVAVHTNAQSLVDTCTLIFLTVSDDAIEPVCSALNWREGQFAVHCSGATELTALRHARKAGAQTGGFHPLLAFGTPELALQALPGCTIAIEAEPPLLDTLHDFAAYLDCRPLALPPGSRALYHASAHYAGAFLNALLGDAVAIWKSFGATEQQALQALIPLARGTLANALDAGLTASLPGVISRGDAGTLEKHLAALQAMPAPVEHLYRMLALRNIPVALARGGINAAQAETLAGLLNNA
jgi:predicted short-subunit dehydrogenase-like oxidoreductase (DUF2520 family)